MINIKRVKQYCKDPINLIENYQAAISDLTQMWVCHHRKEIDLDLTYKELIELNIYYQVPASDLIFLTRSDHTTLHHQTPKRKEQLRERMLGEDNPMRGKQHTQETRKKLKEKRKFRIGKNAPNFTFDITKEDLYNYYILQTLSSQQIAEIYGCSYGNILKLLKKFNIPRRDTSHSITPERRKQISNKRKGKYVGKNNPNYGKHHSDAFKQHLSDIKTKHHISKEELYDLYIVQGLSQYQIAEIYGCSQVCIQRKLKKYNIKK